MKIENVNPADIEKRSMEIIESEGDFSAFSDSERLILKRIIHTTADFDYIKNIRFSENAVESGLNALKNNAVIITDTKMILSGISKPALKALDCEVHCFVSDPDVVVEAKKYNTTRAIRAIHKAVDIFIKDVVFVSIVVSKSHTSASKAWWHTETTKHRGEMIKQSRIRHQTATMGIVYVNSAHFLQVFDNYAFAFQRKRLSLHNNQKTTLL